MQNGELRTRGGMAALCVGLLSAAAAMPAAAGGLGEQVYADPFGNLVVQSPTAPSASSSAKAGGPRRWPPSLRPGIRRRPLPAPAGGGIDRFGYFHDSCYRPACADQGPQLYVRPAGRLRSRARWPLQLKLKSRDKAASGSTGAGVRIGRIAEAVARLHATSGRCSSPEQRDRSTAQHCRWSRPASARPPNCRECWSSARCTACRASAAPSARSGPRRHRFPAGRPRIPRRRAGPRSWRRRR